MIYRLEDLVPTPDHPNHGFYAVNPGADKPFSVLMLGLIPDLAFYGSNVGQFFTRWRYEKVGAEDGLITVPTNDGEVVDEYRQINNITDGVLAKFVAA